MIVKIFKLFFLLLLVVSSFCTAAVGYRVVPCISRGRLPFQPAKSVFRNTEYLYFTNEKVTSATAFCRCQGWNAVLLQIKNKEVQRHIENHMPKLNESCQQSSPHGFYYIGLYRVNGRWLWPDNTRLRNYNNWFMRSKNSACNEPNGYNKACFKENVEAFHQDSVQIFACNGTKQGKWFDKSDTSHWYYICERPVPPANRTTTGTTTTTTSIKQAKTILIANTTSNPAQLFPTNPSLAEHRHPTSVGSTSSSQTNLLGSTATIRDNSSTAISETTNNTSLSFVQKTLGALINVTSLKFTSPSSSSSVPRSSDRTLLPATTQSSLLSLSASFFTPKNFAFFTSSSPPRNSVVFQGKRTSPRLYDCISRILKNQISIKDEDCERTCSRFSKNFEIRDWEDELNKSVAQVLLNQPQSKYFVVEQFPGIKLHLYKISLKSQLKNLFSQNYQNNTEDFWITFNKAGLINHILIRKTDLENLPFPITVIAAEVQPSLWSRKNFSSVNPALPVDDIKDSSANFELNKMFYVLPPKSSVMSVSVYVEDNEKNVVKRSVSTKTVFHPKVTSRLLKEVERKSRRTIPFHASSFKCSFLETNGQLKWSQKGCGLIGLDRQVVTCGCNHTTSFGVILAIRTINIPPTISIVLLALESGSIAALALTLILLLWLKKKIRNDRTCIQINLALSLLLLHLSFLFGGSHFVKYSQTLCEAFSVLTHFFTLTSAMWMLNEGIVLFFKTSKQTLCFNMKKSFPLLASLAWGLPVVMVGISAGIGFSYDFYLDRRFYIQDGTSESNEPVYSHCLVGTRSKIIIYAIILPLAIIFFFTTLILILVTVGIVKMSKSVQKMKPTGSYRRKNSDVNKNTVEAKKNGRRKWSQTAALTISPKHASAALRALMLLLPVLGIPWILGFFVNIENAEEIFIVVHGVVNGLQGVFIFYIYCIKNSQFRRSFSQKVSQYSKKKDLNSGTSSKLTPGFSQSSSHSKRKS